MATAFDGIGMGMLGSEKNYMGGGSSDIKFLLGSLLKKGLDKSSSNVPLPAWPAFEENKSNAVAPPSEPAVAIPPNAPSAPTQNSSESHPETENVLKDLGLQSFVTPDFLKKTDQSESQAILAQANQPVAPPGGMILPNYGQGGGGGGGDIAGMAMKILPMIFGIPA